ncbi:Fe(3+) ABC transporter substrate-binding protein [Paenibacillus sp. J5C_2022]|uniref:Fe(3+) ABC transporter substrate-binding protein n=1 Tax=Paenibacillus sp. J5C2022 TaxID=2977129 RepID=UPI0021D09CF2|nr:Fe(3+) ABC transporter substrate-binding protein [Paenibacillus sp. J5C2022]MCU6710887.1 Fe(3+) ABC transporter substrate-binding protein [Paenibacillus sp. J5C2022]
MRQKAVFKMTMLAIAVMMVLAGCGSNNGAGNGANSGGNGASNNQAGASNGTDVSGGEKEASKGEGVVNVFTARHYDIDFQLFDEFEKKTGIQVNEIKGTAEELVERMKREGESSEADLFITVDGGVLNYAKESGVLQPIESETVNDIVAPELRDADNHWVAMASRARIIAYAKDRVTPDQLSTYEDLADPKWKGKVLIRSSSNLYNQSLVASMIELNGEEAAAKWTEGIVANMARDPEGGDRDQAKAVVAGIGDVAVMNTYYVGQLLHSKDAEEVKVGESIGIFFPNQDTTGTHLNISGIGLAKHAKNKENAIRLIEYMVSKEAQEMLINGSFEFPVNKDAELPAIHKEWGEFKSQQIDYSVLGKNNKAATELMNKAGWK